MKKLYVIILITIIVFITIIILNISSIAFIIIIQFLYYFEIKLINDVKIYDNDITITILINIVDEYSKL